MSLDIFAARAGFAAEVQICAALTAGAAVKPAAIMAAAVRAAAAARCQDRMPRQTFPSCESPPIKTSGPEVRLALLIREFGFQVVAPGRISVSDRLSLVLFLS